MTDEQPKESPASSGPYSGPDVASPRDEEAIRKAAVEFFGEMPADELDELVPDLWLNADGSLCGAYGGLRMGGSVCVTREEVDRYRAENPGLAVYPYVGPFAGMGR